MFTDISKVHDSTAHKNAEPNTPA